jgi:hypothetical protein
MEAQQRYALIDQLTHELESAEQSVRAIRAAAEVDRHTERVRPCERRGVPGAR